MDAYERLLFRRMELKMGPWFLWGTEQVSAVSFQSEIFYTHTAGVESTSGLTSSQVIRCNFLHTLPSSFPPFLSSSPPPPQFLFLFFLSSFPFFHFYLSKIICKFQFNLIPSGLNILSRKWQGR